jgi:hypothetical protein
MKWLILILVVIIGLITAGIGFISTYPHKLYVNWIQGKSYNKYYDIEDYRSDWLNPEAIDAVKPYREDYAQLWKEFPLTNIRIPLPVRHPLYLTIPYLEVMPKSAPHLGVIFLDPSGREQSRLYTLPENILKDHTQGQELFKLPFFRNRILKFNQDKLWKDIFSLKIELKEKDVEAKIYDLYILHLRSKLLPRATVKYGLLNDDKALVELSSKDKDYRIELVMTNNNGTVFSYILRTEKNNNESTRLRSKFLENIQFNPIDQAMGKFLYKEFKQLNFARQVDQEGMLYLFSAWSQDLTNVDMFKELIFYLERGKNNSAQLRPLYAYALKNFGQTFTTKDFFTGQDDPEIVLQRKIEIEKFLKANEAKKESGRVTPAPELGPDEKMNMYLKEAKEEKAGTGKKDMTVY